MTSESGEKHNPKPEEAAEAQAVQFFSQWKVEEADAKQKFSSAWSLGEKTYLLSATNFTDEDGFVNRAKLEKHLRGDRGQSRTDLAKKGLIVQTPQGDWIPPAILRLARKECDQQERPKGTVVTSIAPSLLKEMDETVERNRQARVERDTETRIQTEAKFAKKVRPVRVIIACAITLLFIFCVYLSPLFWGKDVKAFWDETLTRRTSAALSAGWPSRALSGSSPGLSGGEA